MPKHNLSIRIRLELEYGHIEACGCVGDVVAIYIGDQAEPSERACLTCMDEARRKRIEERLNGMRN